MKLQSALALSSRGHARLCPRQILGVRIGFCGLNALRVEPNRANKRLLIIVETDGCFVDGISAATNCSPGHRTLRVEDYGKVAATFVDTQTERAIRVAPLPDIRQRASAFIPQESRRYFAQMQAYQAMKDEEMFSVQEIALIVPVTQWVSRSGKRVLCHACGEEIMNEREICRNGLVLCRACARGGYYKDLTSGR